MEQIHEKKNKRGRVIHLSKLKVGDRVHTFTIACIGSWGNGIISEIWQNKYVVEMDDGHRYSFNETELEYLPEKVVFT